MYKYFVSFSYQKVNSSGQGFANGIFDISQKLDSTEALQGLEFHIANTMCRYKRVQVTPDKVVVMNFQRLD